MKTIPYLNYVHDFVATDRFYVVQMTPFVSTTEENHRNIINGKSSPGEQMR